MPDEPKKPYRSTGPLPRRHPRPTILKERPEGETPDDRLTPFERRVQAAYIPPRLRHRMDTIREQRDPKMAKSLVPAVVGETCLFWVAPETPCGKPAVERLQQVPTNHRSKLREVFGTRANPLCEEHRHYGAEAMKGKSEVLVI